MIFRGGRNDLEERVYFLILSFLKINQPIIYTGRLVLKLLTK